MALNGTEREDNFCHKSAVMQTVCELLPVEEIKACLVSPRCPLDCVAHHVLLVVASGLSQCWSSMEVWPEGLISVGAGLQATDLELHHQSQLGSCLQLLWFPGWPVTFGMWLWVSIPVVPSFPQHFVFAPASSVDLLSISFRGHQILFLFC